MKSYKDYFTDKAFLASFFSGFLFWAISMIANFFATTYANLSGSGFVSDIILSNTRVYNVGGIFVYGAVVAFLFVLCLCITYPKYFPFIFKSLGVFTLIRSVFIILTHVSPFPTHVIVSSVFFSREAFRGIFTGNDLFFSGHTGTPFLLALMFWDDKVLRYLFLGFSLMFATVVLLGHLHYSIDVLSAFFITFSIFNICKYLFEEDWKLFKS